MNIKDIAKLAGVGVSTVSRVINNHPDVKQDTRTKVLEIIKENNYIPNSSARMLKQNNTSYIGVLVKGVFNPFFSEMVKVISDAIEKSDYTMILQHDDRPEEDMDSLIAFAKEKKLRGLIYLGGNFADVPKERFEALDCKTVVLCSNIGDNNKSTYFSSVGIDDYKAAYDAMHYIIQKGHRHIGVIIGDHNDVGVGRERLRGYLGAANDLGIDRKQLYIIEGNYHFAEAYEHTKVYLSEMQDLTAICALSDTMAIGAAKAILESGKQIGKDIAVMGFDGMEIATYYNPSISTVEQPRTAIAQKGIDLLINLVEEKSKHKHYILETTLLERESC